MSEDEDTLLPDFTTEISSTEIHDEIVSMSIVQSLKGVCELNDIENVKRAIIELRNPVLLDHLWTTISLVYFMLLCLGNRLWKGVFYQFFILHVSALLHAV